MSEPAESKKRRGRPPMNPEGAKGGNLTFRVRDGMRERLEASAKARGLSISEDVEKRIERTFEHDNLLGDSETAQVLRALGAVIGRFEASSGASWAKDEATRALAFEAATLVLGALMGLPKREEYDGPAIALDEDNLHMVLGTKAAALDVVIEELHARRNSMDQQLKRLRPRQRGFSLSDALRRDRERRKAAPAEVSPEPAADE